MDEYKLHATKFTNTIYKGPLRRKARGFWGLGRKGEPRKGKALVSPE